MSYTVVWAYAACIIRGALLQRGHHSFFFNKSVYVPMDYRSVFGDIHLDAEYAISALGGFAYKDPRVSGLDMVLIPRRTYSTLPSEVYELPYVHHSLLVAELERAYNAIVAFDLP